ncbi:hypothetical protein ONQ62_27130, partial [Salmonella enterica subsp. enterica serovar Virginia]|nr:hypothetical protein [Salmonella enterica subsp. enterica serovar Virginia]
GISPYTNFLNKKQAYIKVKSEINDIVSSITLKKDDIELVVNEAAIARVEAHFAEEAQAVDRTDGLSMSFANWRFNLRSSNTEPV